MVAYTQLVYSLTRRANTTMLITRMSGLIQGYLSGCFLPSAINTADRRKNCAVYSSYLYQGSFYYDSYRQKNSNLVRPVLCSIGWIILFTIAEVILMHREEREKDIRPVHFMNKTGSSVSAILFED